MRERNLTRHDIGREKFISEVSLNSTLTFSFFLVFCWFSLSILLNGCIKILVKVWDWKTKYGGTILKQLRRLGASLDWTREVNV